MAEIEFVYNDISKVIQCNEDDKFKDLLPNFLSEMKLNPESVNFLYSGKIIENKEQTFSEIAKDSDKEKKKITILIYDIKKCIGEKSDPVIKSKQVICPKCDENCCICVKDFKIRLYNCINNHNTDEISLEDYENIQKIDESQIICTICKTNNKSNSDNKKFYHCNTCLSNLCPSCKDTHEKTHSIIDYNDKNFICALHNIPYSYYCKTCNKNLCETCKEEHNNKNNANEVLINKEQEKKKQNEKETEEPKEKSDEELNNISKKYEEAKNAINNMSKKSIAALKALKKESDKTKLPLKLSAIIYNKVSKKKIMKTCDWNETRAAIIKPDFFSTIKNMNIEDLGKETINIIKQEINNPYNNWDIERIKQAFEEVGLLAEWIESIVMYSDIKDIIDKKKKSKTEKTEIKEKKEKKEKSDKKEVDEIKDEKHELISFENFNQIKTDLIKKLNEYKEIKETFINEIKVIIDKLNKIIYNVDILYKINEALLKNETKYMNYHIFQNLNENNIERCFKTLDEISKERDFKIKFNNIMKICDNINQEDDEIRIIYKIDKTKDKIKILDESFVKENKDNCIIIYDDEQYDLNEFFDVTNIKENKIEIKLKLIKNIDLKGMLYQCDSVFTLLNLSKLKKNGFDINYLKSKNNNVINSKN